MRQLSNFNNFLLQGNKNLKLETKMRKKGVLQVSGADAGWCSVRDHEEHCLQLAQHDKGLGHSQVSAMDTQEVTLELDDTKSSPSNCSCKQCSVNKSEVTKLICHGNSYMFMTRS